MTDNNRIQNTDAGHWVMATAKALGHLKRLAEKQENIVTNTREIMAERQTELAHRIKDARWGEDAAAEDIERYSRMMDEYKRDIERHDALRAAYRAAAAIIEATTGEYHYAARRGYYETVLVKFPTAERRDAWVAEYDDGWHAAEEEDLNQIFWGNALPKNPEDIEF